jgi:hypothetical protein
MASNFLQNYMNNTGNSYCFDSTQAYAQSTGGELTFSSQVDQEVRWWLQNQNNLADHFDSGYVGYPADGYPANGDINNWNSANWKNSVGHGFYRVTGTRQPDGSWSVHLQLTSYYQFKFGELFENLIPADPLRTLEQMALAQNFYELGSGTLYYSAAGQVTGSAGGPVGNC